MLKTINIPANTETTVTANKKYACAYIENQGAADIYASKNPSVVADADDVTKIQAGETKQLLCESDKVYLLSSEISKAEILFSDYLNLNFRKYLKGGERLKNALKDNLNITAADSRLSTIVDKIASSRYAFKLLGETGTLPISSERASLLYKNWLYVAGAHDTGCGLVIIDVTTMQIVKQVFLSDVFYQNSVSMVKKLIDIYTPVFFQLFFTFFLCRFF